MGFKRGLPEDFQKKSKLMLLEEELEKYLNATYKSCTDAQIIANYTNGTFKYYLTDYIDRILHGIDNSSTSIYQSKEGIQEVISRNKFRQELKTFFLNNGLRVFNPNNQIIDLEILFQEQPKITTIAHIGVLQSLQPIITAPSDIIHFPAAITPAPSSRPNRVVNITSKDDLLKMKFFDYIKRVGEMKIKEGKITEVRKKKGGITEIHNPYKTAANEWEEFDSLLTLKDLHTDDCFYFFEHVTEECDVELPGLSNYKKWLKAVLTYAVKQDDIVFDGAKLNRESYIFERNNEIISRPYLTEDMLDVLYKLKVPRHHHHFEYIKDLFYLQSYTGGLSFTDMSQGFKPHTRMSKGELINFVNVTRKKTGVRADIPLTDKAFEILKKYNFKFQYLTNPYYNREIKKVCELAGFTDDFIEQRYDTKTRATTYAEPVPFCSKISSHSARRSFCTNYYYHRNVPAEGCNCHISTQICSVYA
ncbi:MAG: hypothetical protein IPK08_06165 [Bacteroidetes bacterium]|nr:hypothetical protein [Bacteroidota bacterium]